MACTRSGKQRVATAIPRAFRALAALRTASAGPEAGDLPTCRTVSPVASSLTGCSIALEPRDAPSPSAPLKAYARSQPGRGRVGRRSSGGATEPPPCRKRNPTGTPGALSSHFAATRRRACRKTGSVMCAGHRASNETRLRSPRPMSRRAYRPAYGSRNGRAPVVMPNELRASGIVDESGRESMVARHVRGSSRVSISSA